MLGQGLVEGTIPIMKLIHLLLGLCCFLATTTGAHAETAVWSISDPALLQDLDVDSMGTVRSVRVSIRMTGFGGGQHGYCQDMGGDDQDSGCPIT